MWPRIRHMFYGKIFPLPLILKRACCQLLATEWTLYTGKLPLGGLPRKNVVSKDHPVMTSAVYFGHKASNQTKPCNKKLLTLGIVRIKINNNRSTSLERSVINGVGLGAYTCITSMTISFCSGSKHLLSLQHPLEAAFLHITLF